MTFIILNIWPTTVSGWVSLISLLVGLVGTIAALIPTIIKLIKALKTIAKNKDWEKIKNIAVAAIESAEASQKTGSEKKQAVIDAVKEGCKEAGVELSDDLLESLSTYIDSMISYFNNMNSATNTENTK
jgi:hypothetical protein